MRLVVLIIFLLMAAGANAEVSFKQLADITETPDHLEGEFTQEKYLKVLETSFASKGTFVFSKGDYLIWETLEPIRDSLRLTPTSTGANPAMSVIGEILFSVLTAEWEVLSDYFNLQGNVDGENWDITLTPVDATVTTVISRIELSGNSLLGKIVLYENKGDFTTIKFENQRP